ncbi:MAG: amino acid ABC transporter permease [Oscillospiraceae bacterium]|jgi:polar amino acid transport system permease protein|nr:amino acid ABC transporter permease [Oscillospiraceae bacterium]
MSLSLVSARLFESFMLNGEIFFITLLLGLPLGLVVSFGSMSRFRPLSWLTKTFVWIVRGSPLMLQIIIVFYGPGLIWGIKGVGRVDATLVAFVINYACYFSEIFRGGIEGIPAGQKEAGQVLGMTRTQVFFKVTFLQLVKRIVPPSGNEIMTLVKDTALANIIANKEIIMMAQEYGSKGYIWPLFYTLVFFLAACGLLTLLLGRVEKKLSYFR